MKDGFIKVAAAAPEMKVADCPYNADMIIKAYNTAVNQGAKLVVFPEMAVCGYTIGELVHQRALLAAASDAIIKIKNATSSRDSIAVVGFPYATGGAVYNCAAVIANGSLLGIVPKTVLLSSAQSYESRFFTPAPSINSEVIFDSEIVTFGKNQIFACEENPEFTVGVELGSELFAPITPSVQLALAGATVIACPMAMAEIVGARETVYETVKVHSRKINSAYVLANAGIGESSAAGVYSGHSLIAENGTVLTESTPFEQTLLLCDIDVQRLTHDRQKNGFFGAAGEIETVFFTQAQTVTELKRAIPQNPFMPVCGKAREERCKNILDIQAHALARRLNHVRAKSAVVGISGGLDSCLALLVMARSMDILHRDRKDILAVTMPCFGTTGRTKSNAEKMCEALGVSFKEVNIKKAVSVHFEDIGQDPEKYDVTYENSQARERTQVLMDIANMTGGIVVGTGDLSELALGWATYNGDHISMYSVNCDIPKTLVRILVKYCADTCGDEALKVPLYDILGTPVSPELIPPKENGDIAQITEDLVGPYELHDFFIYYFVRYGFTAEKIYRMACIAFKDIYSSEVIQKWLQSFFRRFVTQQFKRSCSPDGPRVGTVALDPASWRMPSDAEYTVFSL